MDPSMRLYTSQYLRNYLKWPSLGLPGMPQTSSHQPLMGILLLREKSSKGLENSRACPFATGSALKADLQVAYSS